MKTVINLLPTFGPFCANGIAATHFLRKSIIPAMQTGTDITFDLEGIKNMNSSFSNALFANLVMQLGSEAIHRIDFRHCNPLIQLMISSALERGLKKISERVL